MRWTGLEGNGCAEAGRAKAAQRGGEQPAEHAFYPRPTNGIFVAITVMNSTLASSGRLAM